MQFPTLTPLTRKHTIIVFLTLIFSILTANVFFLAFLNGKLRIILFITSACIIILLCALAALLLNKPKKVECLESGPVPVVVEEEDVQRRVSIDLRVLRLKAGMAEVFPGPASPRIK